MPTDPLQIAKTILYTFSCTATIATMNTAPFRIIPRRQSEGDERMFRLHERLAEDTVPLRALGLCHVLLMDNRFWPWLVLVPSRPAVVEIHRLDRPDRALLMEEIASVSEVMTELFQPHKLNVGALGNIVPQLHVHVVARFPTDPAWPGPVWGSGHAARYDPAERDALTLRLDVALRQHFPHSRALDDLDAAL